MEEMMDWDVGMGIDQPDYMDVVLNNAAPEPMNFDEGALQEIEMRPTAETVGYGLETVGLT